MFVLWPFEAFFFLRKIVEAERWDLEKRISYVIKLPQRSLHYYVTNPENLIFFVRNFLLQFQIMVYNISRRFWCLISNSFFSKSSSDDEKKLKRFCQKQTQSFENFTSSFNIKVGKKDEGMVKLEVLQSRSRINIHCTVNS